MAVLIPAFDPERGLAAFARDLLERGFCAVVVVDDGSDAGCGETFAELAGVARCEVLRHAVNLGKGRCLKTGLNHILVRYPEVRGVLTADADGQHRAEDCELVARAWLRDPAKLTMGARAFSGTVPMRSRMGNALTRWLFAMLSGSKLQDTQSGLRAIPRSAIPWLLRLTGERYEYEMNVLMTARQQRLEIAEQPIATVYLDGNRSSHFDPLLDSMRVYFVLGRFYISSLLASGLDLICFSIAMRFTGSLLFSLLVGRMVLGPLVNFGVNRRFVFHEKGRLAGPLFRYYLLLGVMATLSWLLIRGLAQSTGMGYIACKVLVEVPISLVSFTAQRIFVFQQDSPAARVGEEG